MKLRALSSDDKATRRGAILSAARTLLISDSRQLPSAARIAEASGLAKGTVYLYFRTKEEIFVSLLAEDFAGLLNEIQLFFDDQWQSQGVADLISRLAAYLNAYPELLRLDAMAYSVLEQNLSEQYLRDFKLALTQRLVAAGATLDQELGLSSGRGVTLLMRTYALIRGLWQSLDHPPGLRALLAEPVFAPIRPDFQTEMVAALDEYWRGALSTPALPALPAPASTTLM